MLHLCKKEQVMTSAEILQHIQLQQSHKISTSIDVFMAAVTYQSHTFINPNHEIGIGTMLYVAHIGLKLLSCRRYRVIVNIQFTHIVSNASYIMCVYRFRFNHYCTHTHPHKQARAPIHSHIETTKPRR